MSQFNPQVLSSSYCFNSNSLEEECINTIGGRIVEMKEEVQSPLSLVGLSFSDINAAANVEISQLLGYQTKVENKKALISADGETWEPLIKWSSKAQPETKAMLSRLGVIHMTFPVGDDLFVAIGAWNEFAVMTREFNTASKATACLLHHILLSTA